MTVNPERILILDNLRSAHNVGTILRTADGAGWPVVYLCGSTPAPHLPGDQRPPYAQDRAAREIAKTALGAEEYLELHYAPEAAAVAAQLRQKGYRIIALEQAEGSVPLPGIDNSVPIALIVGNEVDGIPTETLKTADLVAEIPMRGHKESLNVAVATGIALYLLN